MQMAEKYLHDFCLFSFCLNIEIIKIFHTLPNSAW